MGIELHFTDERWERVARDWSAWWSGELDRPMVVITRMAPAAHDWLPDAPPFTSSLPLEMPADEVIDRYQAHLEATLFYGDAFPKWHPNFGPGIAAGFLGAHLHCTPETVWFSPAREDDIEDLHPSYDPDNIWWRRVQDLTRTAVDRWGGSVSIAHTDLGSNLDILASLRTTEGLLLDLSDKPDEVDRVTRQITGLWLRYYDELCEIIRAAGRGTTPWAPIWSSKRCHMLQSDFSYMISPAMFERFVLPDIEACCEALDHGFYHLDGKGQLPHLDMLLSVERLRGIQWVPGAGMPQAEEWLSLLRRIRGAGKLCQLSVTAEGALTIVRELGSRGFALHICDEMSEQEAEKLPGILAEEGTGC